MVRSLADRTFQPSAGLLCERAHEALQRMRNAVGTDDRMARRRRLVRSNRHRDRRARQAGILRERRPLREGRDRQQGVHDARAVRTLVERFDIEPFPDFSAK